MSVQELQNEVKLLREYTKALEIQNDTRNQQRKLLEKQNDKLRALLDAAQLATTSKNNDALILQIRKLQEKVERIEREKSNLQISYDSLSKQLLSSAQRSNKVVTSSVITSNTTNVQNSYEYTSLKSKYEYSEQQLSKIRLSESKLSEEKVKLQQQVRSLEGMLSKVNSQLYTLQSSLELKESEISKLRNQSTIKTSSMQTTVNKSQYEKVRSQVTEWTYKYDSLERKYKSLQSNQRQFNKERAKFQTRISELEKKISSVSNQLYQAKSQIEMKVNEINRLKIDSLPPRALITSSPILDKNPELQKTKSELQILKVKYEAMLNQNFELKKKGPYSYSLNTQTTMNFKEKEQKEALSRQVTSLQRQNQNLRSEIRSVKLQQQAKFEYQMRQKNQEIMRLQMRIESYQQKINDVLEQQEQQIRISLQNQYQRVEPRNSATSSANINILDGQKLFLKSELNKITSINQSLSTQIINIRKDYSYYVQRHQDMERRIHILEQTNQNLRMELQKSIQRRAQSPQLSRKRRSQYDPAADDNDVYTIQVNPKAVQQKNSNNSKIASDIVFRERDIKNTFQNSHNISSSSINDQKWKSLQYKIHKLKHENDQLKRTLYDMNDY